MRASLKSEFPVRGLIAIEIPMINKIASSLSTFALALSLATPAHADTASPLGAMAQVSLLNGWALPNGNYMAALHVKLAPGWHTYWRAPGAAGIPPQFDWTGSNNIKTAQFHWPVPMVYDQNGMQFLGYEGALVLPIEFTPTSSGKIHVSGEVTLGVCDEVCMPFTAQLQAQFDPQDLAQNKTLIQAMLKQKPKRAKGAHCSAKVIDDGVQLTATMNIPALGGTEMAVIEHPDTTIWVSEAVSTRSGHSVTMTSDMVPANAAPFLLDRSQVRLTVIGEDGKAYEAMGCSGS